ncbi:succinylglutamate desuccinylase/aspartoacylase family protein [Planctobacterium marinum]|uniref:succinylglutamate desuccinylase/aspartoacylase family protein n=1 Tax=Planctobacterium marinum TaxID=1631968 RepID=UPI001E36F14A|nr:succinylglutamate desuccinylase/aspartoacylase family protein [Planctobacterium marinum]MCC2607499.1 succinylglutamate desuccinylase/aspartoacylase family protein [Planctobacterium marinum]
MTEPLEIGKTLIKPGSRVKLELPAARLYTDTEISIPVEVINARKPGPAVFISAAVHGDELNGIEIIRRLLTMKSFRLSKGTIIAVPIVNVYGMLNQSRYMPDRRDLNRSFPGSAKGSLTGRLAHLFLSEIVSKCQYGIDLHTGAIHRSNFPQVRANLNDDETMQLARTFGVPVVLNADIREGSLREAAASKGCKVLLYEAGQALRFDELSIRAGLKGVLNVLSHLGMIRKRKPSKTVEPFVSNHSFWVRATSSGTVTDRKRLGDHVNKGDVLAEICSPIGSAVDILKAPNSGVIIGKQNIPLVQEGDAMYHIADFETPSQVAEHIEQLQDDLLPQSDNNIVSQDL